MKLIVICLVDQKGRRKKRQNSSDLLPSGGFSNCNGLCNFSVPVCDMTCDLITLFIFSFTPLTKKDENVENSKLLFAKKGAGI